MNKLFLATLLLIVLVGVVGMIALLRPPALPQDAQNALREYLLGHDYAVTSTQLATMPGNFGGVCSFYSPEDIADLWCTTVSGGPDHISHFVLHQDDPHWIVVPVFDFDQVIFEAIGCDNW
jgi:hypothetical protein